MLGGNIELTDSMVLLARLDFIISYYIKLCYFISSYYKTIRKVQINLFFFT